MKMPAAKTKVHPILRTASHPHVLNGFHLTVAGAALWAIGMMMSVASTLPAAVHADTGATVTGRVLAGGVAVPTGKVQVYLFQQGQQPSGQCASPCPNSSGVFSISNVTPGSNYFLQVQVIDSTYAYLGKMIQGVTVVTGTNSLGDITLTAAPKTLTVTVTRNTTGAGVANIQVNSFLMGGQQGGPGPNATTDANGQATVRMSGGTWGVNLMAGWVNGQQVTPDWVFVGQQPQVTFASDDTVQSQTLSITVLTATATVKGSIKYPDGTAANNLGLNLRNSNNAFINGNTDGSGNFTFKVVAGGYEFSCFLPPDKAQYACPSATFSINDNDTKDFGTITLTQKTAKFTGRVTCAGSGVANANVNAFSMNNSGPGPGGPGAFTQTGSDGTFNLYVTAGTYGIQVNSQPGSDCVVANGPPAQYTIADNQTVSDVNFTLTKADVTINGVIKDVNGTTVTNFFGYANAMDASGGFGPGKQYGGPVQNGTFQIKLPSSAMTSAIVTVYPPMQGAQYSVKAPATLDIAANGVYSVTLTVAPNDATLSGQVKDAKGNVVTTANGQAFMNNETNSEFHNAEIKNGSYSFSLLGGSKWHLGYHVQGDYQEQPPTAELISVAAGQNVTKDITVIATDATINVTLKDPDGNLVSQGFVNAHQPFNQNLSTKEPPRGSGGPIQNGNGVIHVVGGFTYLVGAGLPPELSTKNYMPPQEQTVKPAVNGSSNVTLQFTKADGSLKGSVKLSTGGTPNFGFVGCWSDKGSHSGGPINNGSYSVSMTKSDTWHCRGNSNVDNTTFYDSGEFTVTTGDSTNFTTTKDITLTKATFTLPQPVTDTVDASQQKVETLSDGTTITIPAGAFGSSGSFTFTATPTVNLTPSAFSKPALGFGYTLGVTNSSGTAVTTFNSSVTVSFPYDATLVSKLGLEPTDLVPKYYDTTTNTWQDVSSVTVNESTHTITFTTDHFTDFALVTAKSATTTLAKVTTSTKNGVTSFTVNGTKVTPFSCKGSLQVATKAVNSTQYIAAGTTCSGDLKIYDATGTLKKTIKSGWKGINHVTMVDVTKDSQPDVIIAPVSDKSVKVVDIANNYAVTTLALGGTGKWTAAGVDLNGKGKSSLVVAKVTGSTASGFKVYGYSKGKFSLSSTPYVKFLKNSNGSIGYTITAATITKISPTSISHGKTSVSVTLTGTNFTPDITATINGVSATVKYTSATSITLMVDGTKIAKGSYVIKLTNPTSKKYTSKLKIAIN